MIGQGATQTQASPSPPHRGPPSQVGEAHVDMLACSPFDSIASPPPSNAGDPRRPSLKAPHPSEVLKCPRCESLDTKFCYYNNYSLTQPRYFCKNCKRYWTAGGALRNVPVGGGLRKNKRSKLKLAADAEAALAVQALAGGVQHHQTDGSLGVGAAGEVPQKVDNRATVSANAARPSHLAVGIPELGMYPHPSRGSTTPHYSEPMVDQRSGAVANLQEGGYYGKNDQNAGMDFFGEPGHVPQFYSSYAASLPAQFGNSITGAVGSGYAVNYNFLPPSENASVEESTKDEQSHTSRGEVKHEKDREGGNHYDWQLISEGLFNAGGVSDGNFFYVPTSSWPDFTQFNDAGPG